MGTFKFLILNLFQLVFAAILASFVSGMIIVVPFNPQDVFESLLIAGFISLVGPLFAAPSLAVFLFVGVFLQRYKQSNYIFWIIPMTFIGFLYSLVLYFITNFWNDDKTILLFTGTSFSTAYFYWWLVYKFKNLPAA